MNLIVGATGTLGTEICRLLISAGKPVRGLVRPTSNGDKVAMLDALGVNLVLGDLKDRKSLDTACRGARAIISTASSTFSRQEGDSIQSVDLQGQLSLLEAAKAAGVAHFVLVSFASVEDEFPLQTAKRTVEEHLKASGIPTPSCSPQHSWRYG
jgi:NADH dehydrogenase